MRHMTARRGASLMLAKEGLLHVNPFRKRDNKPLVEVRCCFASSILLSHSFELPWESKHILD